jgi:hypothetical protein
MRQARLIERITFGPTPSLVDQVASLGADRFLEHQLAYPPATTAGVLTAITCSTRPSATDTELGAPTTLPASSVMPRWSGRCTIPDSWPR